MKRNIQELYNLPSEIIYCKKCTISNQRPRITFNDEGVCSACEYAEFKKTKINWNQRDNELKALCDKHRKNDGSYDVIVPCSGGKDGSYVAHMLKFKYGMNPLTVTWSPLLPTLIGRRNLDAFISSGFDNILGRTNGKITRKLTSLSFKHMGDPFQPFIYGQVNFPIKMAVQHNVSLIMYGENGEVEYGGSMKNAFRPDRPIDDDEKTYFSGLAPDFWEKHGITKNDLAPFMRPDFQKIKENKTEISEQLKERYSSREGFSSFHSTDLDEWIEDLALEFEVEEDCSHKWGTILEILSNVLDIIDEEEMVDKTRGNVSLDYELK